MHLAKLSVTKESRIYNGEMRISSKSGAFKKKSVHCGTMGLVASL